MGISSEAEVEVVVKNENIEDLLLAFRAMVDLGRTVKPDMTRYYRLEAKVNALWPRLSNPEQLVAVQDLVGSGHMHQNCADALVVLGGRVDMGKPQEPCIKLGVEK